MTGRESVDGPNIVDNFLYLPPLLAATLPWWRGLCVSMILRTQPAEAREPLAGTTKPERSTGRNQTKGSHHYN